MENERQSIEAEVDRLVDEYRSRCLWYLRPGYYPADDAQRERALERIQRHGDRAAFVRAARLRRWLSRNSREASAAS